MYTFKANKQKLPLLALAAGAAGLIQKAISMGIFDLAELVLPLFSFLHGRTKPLAVIKKH